MTKTVHYVDGCPWADGHIHSADTRQTKDWSKVTCKHCLRRWNLPRIEQWYARKVQAK